MKNLNYEYHRLLDGAKHIYKCDPEKKTNQPINAESRYAIYWGLIEMGFTYHQIEDVSGYDHSTVYYGVKKIKGLMDIYPEVRGNVKLVYAYNYRDVPDMDSVGRAKEIKYDYLELINDQIEYHVSQIRILKNRRNKIL